MRISGGRSRKVRVRERGRHKRFEKGARRKGSRPSCRERVKGVTGGGGGRSSKGKGRGMACSKKKRGGGGDGEKGRELDG